MKYRIVLASKICPGWEFYQGKIEVDADNDAEAELQALKRVRRNFPERGPNAWDVVSVKRQAT